MELLVATLVFIFGACIGSFLSATIYRLKNKKTKFVSRSMCPACKKKLKPAHLFPVLSFLFLRGRCAYCENKISIHYFLLEILTGLTFLILLFKFNFVQILLPSGGGINFAKYFVDFETLNVFIFWAIEFSLLIGIFFYDLLYKEIPDSFSLPAISIAILGGLLMQSLTWTSMLFGALSIFGFFLLQFLLSKGTWLGAGDLRLGILMGVLLGLEQGLLALVLAYFIGAAFSMYLLARAKVNRKSQIAFGPFLVIGIYLSFFYGEQILDFYFNQILI